MTTNDYEKYVSSRKVYWASVRNWVKPATFVFGGLVGLIVWWVFFISTIQLTLLLFLGSGKEADAAKIISLAANVCMIFTFPFIGIFLTRLALYLISASVVMRHHAWGDILFKTEEELKKEK